MLNRLKKNDKKGFTLVELIVVLIILAILAALLVPALTGYIDKAKEKQLIAETRQAVMAAQTLVDEEYAKGSTITFTTDPKPASPVAGTIYASDIRALAEVKGDVTVLTFPNGQIETLTYKQDGTGGKTCEYTQAGNPQYAPK